MKLIILYSLLGFFIICNGQTTVDPNNEDDVVASEALSGVWGGFSSEVMRIPDFAANTRLMIMSFGRFGIFMQIISGERLPIGRGPLCLVMVPMF
uniref:Predicted gene 1553 n=1 Tax=Mus spicilegus TaxID=10103 RepID=A0A8C6G9F1_MUSSI